MFIETSASHQAVGFIIKRYNGINISPCADKKSFLLALCQIIDVQSCVAVPRYQLLWTFP